MATKSKFSDVLSKIAFVIAVLLTLFQSYTALFGVLTAVYQRAIHLGLASSYIFLFNMANPKEKGKVFHIIINFIGLVASAGSNFYICLHYAEIQGRLGITTELDMIFGALLLVAILIMGYESLGWALPTISVIFLLYGLFGHLIPGALSHQAFTFKRLISFLYLGTEGVFGSAMSVSATFIFIFILFGAFLEKSGARPVLREPGTDRHRARYRRSRAGRRGLQRPDGHHLRQRRIQRRDHRHLHHSADEGQRL